MDCLPKQVTEDMSLSWSKQCLFPDKECVVDKEQLCYFFLFWFRRDINRQSFFTYLGRSAALKSFTFFSETKKKTIKGKKQNVFRGIGIDTVETLVKM